MYLTELRGLVNCSRVVVDAERLERRREYVTFARLRLDTQVEVAGVVPAADIQPGDVLTRLILRQRRFALRVVVYVREIKRSHARVVVMAETMPDAVLFIDTHMAHLHRQEIFEHRLPDPALVYVLGDAEYARLGVAVDYFVQSLVSDVRKVEFQICIAQEAAPLVGVGFIYLHRAVCGNLIYRGFIVVSFVNAVVSIKIGAAVELDNRDLRLRRVVADLRGLHNRLVHPVGDDIRCDRQVDRA